ncbi:hypothetical protein OAory_01082980 [Aspergillus oryzae]|uniref:Uncharacterized protein n=3 Tax=Aspergillus oryzae TaxID=5062 RepID=A0A1S9DRV9_ASPOZ|nr:hypothetical protein OAory_01082980 [Aspergillus oryzae]
MKEIGLEGHGISPVAASEPFSLFTPETIKQIHAEVFSEPVLADCQYSSTFARNMGRYLEHQALKALGGRERISMVTAFRPKSHLVRDEMVLSGSRAISNWSELYTGYTGYKMELLEERPRAKLKEEKQRERSNRPLDIPGMKRFLEEQKALLELTIEEFMEVEDID